MLARVSPGYPPLPGRSPTCYSPVRRSPAAEAAFAHDLHVLSTPPAFILSQDQTLQFRSFHPPRRANRHGRLSFGIRSRSRPHPKGRTRAGAWPLTSLFLCLVFNEPTLPRREANYPTPPRGGQSSPGFTRRKGLQPEDSPRYSRQPGRLACCSQGAGPVRAIGKRAYFRTPGALLSTTPRPDDSRPVTAGPDRLRRRGCSSRPWRCSYNGHKEAASRER